MFRFSVWQHPTVERMIQIHDRNGFQHLSGFLWLMMRFDPPGMKRSILLLLLLFLTEEAAGLLQILHTSLDFFQLIQLPLLLDRALLRLIERSNRMDVTPSRRRIESTTTTMIPILKKHS